MPAAAEVARPEWGLVAIVADAVISRDGRAFVYREACANPDSTEPAVLRVVDLDAPGQAVTIAEAPAFHWVLTPS